MQYNKWSDWETHGGKYIDTVQLNKKVFRVCWHRLRGLRQRLHKIKTCQRSPPHWQSKRKNTKLFRLGWNNGQIKVNSLDAWTVFKECAEYDENSRLVKGQIFYNVWKEVQTRKNIEGIQYQYTSYDSWAIWRYSLLLQFLKYCRIIEKIAQRSYIKNIFLKTFQSSFLLQSLFK